MDPTIAAALITGGVNAVLGLFGGFGDAELAEMDNDTKLKIAADQLGLNYNELKENQRQYDASLRQRITEWGDKMGIDRETLAMQKEEMKRKYGLEERRVAAEEKQTTAEISKGMREAAAQRKEQQRRAQISQAITRGAPGRRTMAVKPTAAPETQKTGAGEMVAGPMAMAGGV